MLKYCKDENYLQILKVDGVDTIGIFEKEFLYLFQYIIKIQRSFSKIADISTPHKKRQSHY
jgi:hypothetical protein